MPESPRASTVLVAEDSDEDYEALTRAFRSASPEIPLARCTDGDEVLEYLYGRGSYSDAPRPGLLVLDLNLPGTDGREVLEILKSDPDLKLLPVIVLTTSASPRDVEAAYREGANSYVFKPRLTADFERIVSAVKAFWFESAVLPNVTDYSL